MHTHPGPGLPLRDPSPEPHPLRARFNAALLGLLDGYMHRKYADLKARLFADLPPVVLELGAGAGANFRYFAPGTRVIAAEPSAAMHERLRCSARRRGIALDVRGSRAEALDVPDASVDAVVASLVLCTVEDPAAAVREVLRVLRPGGRFVCIEHVAAPARSLTGWAQRRLHRPWRWLFEGCHTHRDTARTLAEAGFSRVELVPFTCPTLFVPIRPQLAAVCTR